MGKKLEIPKFPKPIRAAAIIETAQGVLLVQDIKDRFRQETLKELVEDRDKYLERGNKKDAARKEAAMKIVEYGRFALPGGGIDPIDYTNAGAESLLALNRPPSTREEVELFRDVVREAAIREVGEEIGTQVCFEQVPTVIEIHGRQRHHIICIMRAEGELDLEPRPDRPVEISGIGFLNEENIIPLNRFFFQAHVQKLMGKYIKKPQRHRVMVPRYLSHLRVPVRYMDRWYENMLYGYHNRSSSYRNAHPLPERPSSSPTFVIFGEGNGIHNPFIPPTFTDVARAKIVPPMAVPDEFRSLVESDDNQTEGEDVAPMDSAVPIPRYHVPLPVSIRRPQLDEHQLHAIINAPPEYLSDDLEDEDTGNQKK